MLFVIALTNYQHRGWVAHCHRSRLILIIINKEFFLVSEWEPCWLYQSGFAFVIEEVVRGIFTKRREHEKCIFVHCFLMVAARIRLFVDDKKRSLLLLTNYSIKSRFVFTSSPSYRLRYDEIGEKHRSSSGSHLIHLSWDLFFRTLWLLSKDECKRDGSQRCERRSTEVWE